MKTVKLTLHINIESKEVLTPKGEEEVILSWLNYSIDELTHESFDGDDHKLGDLDVKVVSAEIEDA